MFKNLSEVKKSNKLNGYHWFDSCAYFKTEIHSPLMTFEKGNGEKFQVFLFSDYSDEAKQRLFNIAKVYENGRVVYLGSSLGYPSANLAWENLGNDLN